MMIKRGKSLAIKNMLHGIFLVGLVIQANVIAAQETDRDGTAANAIKSIKRFQSTRPVKAATVTVANRIHRCHGAYRFANRVSRAAFANLENRR